MILWWRLFDPLKIFNNKLESENKKINNNKIHHRFRFTCVNNINQKPASHIRCNGMSSSRIAVANLTFGGVSSLLHGVDEWYCSPSPVLHVTNEYASFDVRYTICITAPSDSRPSQPPAINSGLPPTGKLRSNCNHSKRCCTTILQINMKWENDTQSQEKNYCTHVEVRRVAVRVSGSTLRVR